MATAAAAQPLFRSRVSVILGQGSFRPDESSKDTKLEIEEVPPRVIAFLHVLSSVFKRF